MPAHRIERILHARGLLRDPGDDPAPVKGEDGSLLPFLSAASVQSRAASGPELGRALERLIDPHLTRANSELARFTPGSLRAESSGYSLRAATCIAAPDRGALEHLCRNVARPPLAQGRLLLRDDGKVIWNLRKPCRDGTRGFVLDPLVFFERLVALIPHPREHQFTYHGVLAPASPLRDDVVPLPTSRRAPSGQWADPPSSAPAPRKRFSWAELLRRVFAVDVLACRREPKAAATSCRSSPTRPSSAASSRTSSSPRSPSPWRPPAPRPSPACHGDPAGGPHRPRDRSRAQPTALPSGARGLNLVPCPTRGTLRQALGPPPEPSPTPPQPPEPGLHHTRAPLGPALTPQIAPRPTRPCPQPPPWTAYPRSSPLFRGPYHDPDADSAIVAARRPSLQWGRGMIPSNPDRRP